jgi:hypothetical protein
MSSRSSCSFVTENERQCPENFIATRTRLLQDATFEPSTDVIERSVWAVGLTVRKKSRRKVTCMRLTILTILPVCYDNMIKTKYVLGANTGDLRTCAKVGFL